VQAGEGVVARLSRERPAAVLRMASVIPRLRSLALPNRRRDQNVRVADAQHVIARELGHSSWAAMVRHLSTPPKAKAKP
jgi:hypothetical protein